MPDSAPASSRDRILGRVRDATRSLPEPAPLPDYDPQQFILPAARDASDLWEFYAQRAARVNGRTFDDIPLLMKHLADGGHHYGYCEADLLPIFTPHCGERIELTSEFDRGDIDRFAFGITRARGAIAESGSLILADAQTPRLPALTPWVHIAVVPEDALFRDIPSAMAALPDDPNIVWCTGPSKTADVEGILIEGVHGPGEQITLRLRAEPR